MLKNWKKNGKKGFTLVELIVVLVILAILAALLVPSLIGYIDKAREQQIVAQTRQAVMAAQTLVDIDYGAANGDTITYNNATLTEIAKLAELRGTPTEILDFTPSDAAYVTGGKVIKLIYKDAAVNKQCTYTYDDTNGGKYTIADKV